MVHPLFVFPCTCWANHRTVSRRGVLHRRRRVASSPSNMAPRDTKSKAPIPSIERIVALPSMSVKAWTACATHSHPERVVSAHWNGEVASSTWVRWREVQRNGVRHKEGTARGEPQGPRPTTTPTPTHNNNTEQYTTTHHKNGLAKNGLAKNWIGQNWIGWRKVSGEVQTNKTTTTTTTTPNPEQVGLPSPSVFVVWAFWSSEIWP